MIIRPAKAGDVPRLAILFDQLGHPIDEAALSANLADLDALALPPLVAEVDGTVLGVCGLAIMRTIHRPYPVGRISTLVVDDEAHGNGIGTRLVEAAEQALAAQGCRLVEVTSNESRTRAHRFYENLGYDRTSVRFAKAL